MTDLSTIVTDPDFATMFDVETRVESVGENGRAAFGTMINTATGAIIPDGESLKRQPDGSRLSGAIKVYTCRALWPADEARQADVVIWNGARYTVMAVSDLSQWDSLRVASCELAPFTR